MFVAFAAYFWKLAHVLVPLSYTLVQYPLSDSGVDALRLLVLLPRSSPKDKGIKCELHHRAFGSKPVYEALSYTWGTQPATKAITINGNPFLVRSNLYNALLHLQLPCQPDGIRLHPYRASFGLAGYLTTELQSGFFSDEQWYAVSHNPYWTRLCIIQELVLAHEVVFHLGNNSLDWERVESTMNPAWRALERRSDSIKKLRDERYTSAWRLENLVEHFKKAQCTEKRDKIYGFLGLVYDGSDKAITVDYKIGFAQLYAQVIRFHQTTSAPSDSPFSGDIDRAVKLVKFSQLIQNVLGGAVAEEESQTGVDWPNTLRTAMGFIAGEIIRLGPTPIEIVSSVRSDKTWKQTISEAYRQSSELQQARNTYAAFSQTILSWDEKRLGRVRALYSEYSFGYRLGAGEEAPSFTKEDTENTDLPEARLFLGTKSLRGVAPRNARVGDLICTFLGSNVALVLRKIAETEDRYMFVGRAERFREETEDSDGDSDGKDGIEHDFSELTLEERQPAPGDTSFQNFINLKIDLETLHKLSA
ncbi:hypothetical protein EDB81DRAFT_852151 [Dactylonectria macrodidyma]|uniref:Heterokaryon incompatibility domain-containing protein n=1 Tax=Dactylonectria macrodidyma TaxID=307937 RepID=A0A9P9FL67_9HYPO|nr:hypothetical protein EDB81DRAFT_852151 [Dactylonectria macrodidyma]